MNEQMEVGEGVCQEGHHGAWEAAALRLAEGLPYRRRSGKLRWLPKRAQGLEAAQCVSLSLATLALAS